MRFALIPEYAITAALLPLLRLLVTLHHEVTSPALAQKELFVKISCPNTVLGTPVLITNDEPRNNERTPKLKKVLLLRLTSFFLLLCLALFHRPTTERRPRERRINSMSKKVLFLMTKPEKG